jgi:hypothetical protein
MNKTVPNDIKTGWKEKRVNVWALAKEMPQIQRRRERARRWMMMLGSTRGSRNCVWVYVCVCVCVFIEYGRKGRMRRKSRAKSPAAHTGINTHTDTHTQIYIYTQPWH